MIESKTEILVVGTHDDIRATVLRLLNTNVAWHAIGVAGLEEAISECANKAYEVLLIGAGLADDAEKELAERIREIYPKIHIVPHYGGGSGLLFAEIYLALAGGTKNQAQ